VSCTEHEEHPDVVRTHSLPRHRSIGLFVALAVCAAAVCTIGAAAASARALSAGATNMCTKASIAPAVAKAGKAHGTIAKLRTAGFKCAGGWAYANADLGPAKHAIAVTFIFEGSGRAWILKNRATACKAPGNLVPAALFKAACASN
jgi:hypothetical protein